MFKMEDNDFIKAESDKNRGVMYHRGTAGLTHLTHPVCWIFHRCCHVRIFTQVPHSYTGVQILTQGGFTYYLEATASMELAGIACLPQNPFFSFEVWIEGYLRKRQMLSIWEMQGLVVYQGICEIPLKLVFVNHHCWTNPPISQSKTQLQSPMQ